MKTARNNLRINPHGVILLIVLCIFLVSLVSVFKYDSGNINSKLSDSAEAQSVELKAFPGAEGFGAFTKHGRGGRVIEVTNLNASGVGSFRSAIEASGPRIIVFKVGGLIKLGSTRLKLTNPYVYIAGQTAPGDGITISETALEIETHDVLIRHVRFRAGDSTSGYAPGNRDSISIRGTTQPVDISSKYPATTYNIILDHISATWGIDGNLDIGYGAKNITVQDSLISEGLNNSLHPEGAHSSGILIAENSHNISILRNVLANNRRRNPLSKSNTSFEFINNVIYNYNHAGHGTLFDKNTPETGIPSKADFIGNYYKSNKGAVAGYEIYTPADQSTFGWKIYGSNNIGPNRVDDSLAQNLFAHPNLRPAFVSSRQVSSNLVSIRQSQPNYTQVLSKSGANIPSRDKIDNRIINHVINNTGGLIDSTAQVGGFITNSSVSTIVDTDKDGMSNNWENINGLNPSNDLDAAKDADNDGYTNLEEYLEELITGFKVPVETIKPTQSPIVTQRPTASPSTKVTASPSASIISGDSTIVVHAMGTPLNNIYPKLEVYINGLKHPITIETSAKLSQYVLSTTQKINSLEIKYINDESQKSPFVDRNAFIDKVTINGKDYQSEDPSVYSVGSWNSSTGCAPGYKLSEWLHCGGSFTYNIGLDTVPQQVIIKARGNQAQNIYPIFELILNGVKVKSYQVNSDFQNYSYLHTGDLISTVQINFINDFYNPALSEDRNLQIDFVQIGNSIYNTENNNVLSEGSWNALTDCQSGYKQSEWLHCNGYFKFVL